MASRRNAPELWRLELNAMEAVCHALEPLPPSSRMSVLRWVAKHFDPEHSSAQQPAAEHAVHPAAEHSQVPGPAEFAEHLQVPTLHELAAGGPFVPHPSAEPKRLGFAPVLAPAAGRKASAKAALIQKFPILERLTRSTRRT